MLNDDEDLILDGAHDRVGPEAGVRIEVGGETLAAAEMKQDAIGAPLKLVFAVEDVEEWAADGDSRASIGFFPAPVSGA